MFSWKRTEPEKDAFFLYGKEAWWPWLHFERLTLSRETGEYACITRWFEFKSIKSRNDHLNFVQRITNCIGNLTEDSTVPLCYSERRGEGRPGLGWTRDPPSPSAVATSSSRLIRVVWRKHICLHHFHDFSKVKLACSKHACTHTQAITWETLGSSLRIPIRPLLGRRITLVDL